MHKLFLAFCLLLITSSLQAFSCGENCNIKCKKGFLGDLVDPICFSGCKAWQLAKCYYLSDPLATAFGEAGSKMYREAASFTRNKNDKFRGLSRIEKGILRPFYGDLVDEVEIYDPARLMSEWGGGAYAIELGQYGGQTFGKRIYLDDTRDYTDISRVVLLGHELCHTEQFIKRGSSFEKFGRDYFEGFAKGGGCSNNHMEKECVAKEQV